MGGCMSGPHNAALKSARETKRLHLERMSLKRVPDEVQQLADLEELWLYDNGLTDLPQHVSTLQQLALVYVNGNDLSEVPSPLAELEALEEFNISQNARVRSVPAFVGRWTRLKQIYLNDLPLLTALPDEIRMWSSLTVLHCNNCALKELPAGVSSLRNLKQVALNGNQLQTLPAGVGCWTKVVKLFANDNALVSLPDEIGNCSSLEKLYVNGNKLRRLPSTLGSLQSLDELYAEKNELVELPMSLSRCTSLNKLHVPHNKLQRLPLLGECTRLEILHVGHNMLNTTASLNQEKQAAAMESNGSETLTVESKSEAATGDWLVDLPLQQLKFLHLNHNSLTHLPAAFTERVKKSKELRVCDFSDNPALNEDDKTRVVLDEISRGLVRRWSFHVADHKEQGGGESNANDANDASEAIAQRSDRV